MSLSWLELTNLKDRAEAHMRRKIVGRVANLKRPHRDAMDNNPLSLDAPNQIEDE